MFNISQYLEKFKNFGQGERLLKEVIISVIKEVVGADIESKNINFKNGEIILNVSPAIKNAVFIKKATILNKIKEKTEQIVLEIR